MDDNSIEEEIQSKGKTAARITPADIEANIDGEYYFTAAQGVQAAMGEQDELTRLAGFHGELRLLTFCVLHLQNGFTVAGESAVPAPRTSMPRLAVKLPEKTLYKRFGL